MLPTWCRSNCNLLITSWSQIKLSHRGWANKKSLKCNNSIKIWCTVQVSMWSDENCKRGYLEKRKQSHVWKIFKKCNNYWNLVYLNLKTICTVPPQGLLIVLGFNDMSTLEGHFVSSPREREKRDRRESRGDEREGQGRKRNRNESEETEEIKTFPLYPYPLQG